MLICSQFQTYMSSSQDLLECGNPEQQHKCSLFDSISDQYAHVHVLLTKTVLASISNIKQRSSFLKLNSAIFSLLNRALTRQILRKSDLPEVVSNSTPKSCLADISLHFSLRLSANLQNTTKNVWVKSSISRSNVPPCFPI